MQEKLKNKIAKMWIFAQKHQLEQIQGKRIISYLQLQLAPGFDKLTALLNDSPMNPFWAQTKKIHYELQKEIKISANNFRHSKFQKLL